MSYKHISYENMQSFVSELKTKYAKKSELTALQNVIEGVKVNGSLLTLTNKIADILISEGTANGTVKVNNANVAVHGLAALAYKSQVAESDLASALKTLINSKAAQADLNVLTGSGEGSISKMIDDAFNEFATNVSNDGVVNSFKELVDWVAEHGAEAAEMAGDITANATAIANLRNLIGTIPTGATSTTVVGYIAEAIAAIGIGDYATTASVTSAISTALASYYTKAQIDTTLEGYVEAADFETVTAAEMIALLA